MNLERVCDEDCAAFEKVPIGPQCGLLTSLKKIAGVSDMWQRAVEQGWADKLTGGR